MNAHTRATAGLDTSIGDSGIWFWVTVGSPKARGESVPGWGRARGLV
ncbi:hypothetical protein [Streptomyces sp. NPDC048606]